MPRVAVALEYQTIPGNRFHLTPGFAAGLPPLQFRPSRVARSFVPRLVLVGPLVSSWSFSLSSKKASPCLRVFGRDTERRVERGLDCSWPALRGR